MALELVVAWAGRHRRDRWDELCADYRQRAGRLLPVREIAVRAATSGDDRARLRREAEALRAAVPGAAWTIALDRRGATTTSLGLAGRIERWRREWSHPVVFFIGSDLGLDPDFTASCRERLSLGPLTLPHELARLVLWEQLYRALSIGSGIGYHRGPSDGS